jgi:hypothetical protein
LISNKNMNSIDKLLSVQKETEKMQDLARIKHNKASASDISHGKKTVFTDFDQIDETNSMLLDAIKAKLAILD